MLWWKGSLNCQTGMKWVFSVGSLTVTGGIVVAAGCGAPSGTRMPGNWSVKSIYK